MRAVGWILLALAVVAVIGGGAFAWYAFSGRYNVAATYPHAQMVEEAIARVMHASVERHAEGLSAPELSDAQVAKGMLAYSEDCAMCHGAPGTDRLGWAAGMMPEPPHLSREALEFDAAEVYWIVDQGIRMTGMPAWDGVMPDEEMWNVAVAVTRLPDLSSAEYQRMLATAARARTAAAGGESSDGGASSGGGSGSGDTDESESAGQE